MDKKTAAQLIADMYNTSTKNLGILDALASNTNPEVADPVRKSVIRNKIKMLEELEVAKKTVTKEFRAERDRLAKQLDPSIFDQDDEAEDSLKSYAEDGEDSDD